MEEKRNPLQVKRLELDLSPIRPSGWEAGVWLHWGRKQGPHDREAFVLS